MPGKKVMEFGDFGEGGLKIRIVNMSDQKQKTCNTTKVRLSYIESPKNVTYHQNLSEHQGLNRENNDNDHSIEITLRDEDSDNEECHTSDFTRSINLVNFD